MLEKCGVVALCAVLLLHSAVDSANGKAHTVAGCLDVGVAVSVSSLVSEVVERQLQLSYWNASPQPGDYVGLYNVDPNPATEPLAVLGVTAVEGHMGSTGVAAPWIDSTELPFSTGCLGYWAAYVRDQEILAVSCLGNRPTWMSDNRQELGSMKLRDMFLPGTHDAAAYHNHSDNVLNKYTYTQEEDIFSQLSAGVRYLDMRVTYADNTEALWWTNHGVVLLHPLSEITQHVRSFLDNTEEIVIFDIHGLTGFGTMDVHTAFVAWLTNELGNHMASSSLTWETTLDAVWASGKRLIVTYADNQVMSQNELLWSTVLHQWGNVQNMEALYQYLAGVMNNPPSSDPWSAMAELTARASDLVTDDLGGLRQMANDVNYNVTLWFRGAWGETVNIVATDFFRGTLLVEEAIEWNLRRSAGTSC